MGFSDERDEMIPPIETASIMAQSLDVSLDWLMEHTVLKLGRKMIQFI